MEHGIRLDFTGGGGCLPRKVSKPTAKVQRTPWRAAMRCPTIASLLTTGLLGSAMLAGASNAAERYVDNSGAPPCSNSWSAGSQSRPWCTINYAVDRASPGDIVYVKNGTYREDVYIDGKHGGENYITL